MGSQRLRSIDYAPLEKSFTTSSCTVDAIDLPDIVRSHIATVQLSTESAAQFYHTSEKKEIVDFTVTYIPHDNPAGRKLLPQVHELVEAVLKKGYDPANATIQVTRNGNAEQTIQIHDCVIISGEIQVDMKDYVRIVFSLQGLLQSAY